MEGHPNDLPTYYSNIMLMIWFILFKKIIILTILNKNKKRFTAFYNTAVPLGSILFIFNINLL